MRYFQVFINIDRIKSYDLRNLNLFCRSQKIKYFNTIENFLNTPLKLKNIWKMDKGDYEEQSRESTVK